MNDVHTTFADQGLVRPRDGRVIAGVCAGLGRRFGFGPWTARLLFVLVLLVVPGSQLIVYPVLWILMPKEEQTAGPAGCGRRADADGNSRPRAGVRSLPRTRLREARL